jgi:hypothetical protein
MEDNAVKFDEKLIDKELTKEQYNSEEYKVGYSDGISSVLGQMQRGRGRGLTLDIVIEQVFEKHKDIYG